MTPQTDDRILEVMRSEGNMTPLAVSGDGEIPRVKHASRSHAGNRMRIMARYGLLFKLDRGVYGLTEAGRAYLDEDLDAKTLEPSPILGDDEYDGAKHGDP
jgi:hypothetical protein